jgi:uncharacterized membrane protein YheB (UPF0754 family)
VLYILSFKKFNPRTASLLFTCPFRSTLHLIMKAVYPLLTLFSAVMVTAGPLPSHARLAARINNEAPSHLLTRTEPLAPDAAKAAADAMESMHVAEAEAKEKAHQEAAAKMEAEHVAKAEAEAKAAQESAAAMEVCLHLRQSRAHELTTTSQAIHVASEQAKDAAHKASADAMESMHVASEKSKDAAHKSSADAMEAMHMSKELASIPQEQAKTTEAAATTTEALRLCPARLPRLPLA